MRLDQRQRHALQAEAQARSAGHLAVRRLDVEGAAEVVLVPVERADRGRLLRGDHRAEDLELQALVALARGHHLAAAAEERIVGDVARDRQSQRLQQREAALQPGVAPFDDFVGRADADELAHAEGLQAGGLGRGLVAIDPVGERDQAAARRQRAREHRVDRVAGGRGQHGLGDLEHVLPALAACTHSLSARASFSSPKKLWIVPHRCGKLSM